LDSLFLVTLIFTAIFSAGLLAVPTLLLGVFGMSLNASAGILARLFGSALISLTIILGFARNSISIRLKQGVIYGMFTYYLLSIILFTIARVSGLTNTLGWALVGFQGLFMSLFGAFLFRDEHKSPDEATPRRRTHRRE
jgi:hypothetical protein